MASDCFEHNGYHITFSIDECRDAYGTGDSPTLYDVEFISIEDEDGNLIDENDLGRFFYDELIQEAINTYTGG